MKKNRFLSWKQIAVSLLVVASISMAGCGSTVTTAKSQNASTTAGSQNATTAAGSQNTMTAGTSAASINQKITAEAGKALLAKTPGAILLDVRTAAENKELRIPGSTLIPVDDLPNRLSELPKDPAKPIIVYCRSGNRSATAAAILVKAGFPAVYDMGGIINWPYETQKG